MKRMALDYLNSWIGKKSRKPLIVRGARQVGKSTLVRLFAEQAGHQLIEVNLEIERLGLHNSQSFDLNKLLDEIQIKKNQKITDNSILFLDEIQEQPELLKNLRYFYEKRPDIKVIVAGSLLEVALKSEQFSFPVGRVEFYHLGPMNFREFLWATERTLLDESILNQNWSESVHQLGLQALKEYFYVGGMPEAVKNYVESKSMVDTRHLQNQLLLTYQADFPKYNSRIDLNRMNRVFSAAANQLGQKVIYSRWDSESKAREVRRVMELLIDARVILPCIHTDGNQIPLAGESDLSVFKTYFLDIGLLNCMMRLDLKAIDENFQKGFSTKGSLAEQFVAQQMCSTGELTQPPTLYYYLRDKGTQKAEVDFLIEHETSIIPIEVKSSASGHLKSLKLFCKNKKTSKALRFSTLPYKVEDNFVVNNNQSTTLYNLPLYGAAYISHWL